MRAQPTLSPADGEPHTHAQPAPSPMAKSCAMAQLILSIFGSMADDAIYVCWRKHGYLPNESAASFRFISAEDQTRLLTLRKTVKGTFETWNSSRAR